MEMHIKTSVRYHDTYITLGEKFKSYNTNKNVKQPGKQDTLLGRM